MLGQVDFRSTPVRIDLSLGWAFQQSARSHSDLVDFAVIPALTVYRSADKLDLSRFG
jgi:hypothetical protein